MRRIPHSRPSPAMAVACLALIIAMGGTGYAAINLPRNSVGSKQLKPRSVGSSDIKSHAVRSRHLKDNAVGPGRIAANTVGSRELDRNSVTSSKIRRDAVTSSRVRNGSLLAEDFQEGQLPSGAQGPAGPQGETGPQGANAFDTLDYKQSNSITASATGYTTSTLACDAGWRAIGGGFDTDSDNLHPRLSRPTNSAGSAPGTEAWTIGVQNTNIFDQTFRVYLICAPPGNTTTNF